MPPTNPDHERLLALDGVHTVAPDPDAGVVRVGVSEVHQTLPKRVLIDGDLFRVETYRRRPAESGRYQLMRARAAHRAAAAGYHPHVPAGYLRAHRDALALAPTRRDGGAMADSPDADGTEANARSGPRDEKQRPLAGGLAIGQGDGYYGTLTGPVRVADTTRGVWADSVAVGDLLLATNRHVLDHDLGADVYQPAASGGSYHIGTLVGYVPLKDGTRADIAVLAPDDDLDLTDWEYWGLDGYGGSIQRRGYDSYVGQQVVMSAANSGVVTGTMTGTGVTTQVDYGGSIGTVTVYDTNETDDISRGGDSGSQRFNSDRASMDLDFASDSGFRDGGHAQGVTVDNCERALGVRFLTPSDLRALRATSGGYVAVGGGYYAAGGSYTGPGGDVGDPTVPPDPRPDPTPTGPTGPITIQQRTDRRGTYASDYATVLDAVDDCGLDPTGGTAINGTLEGYLDDNTLIDFPEGTYRVTGNISKAGLSNVGLIGEGDCRLVVDADYNDQILTLTGPGGILVEGFVVDQTAANCLAGVSIQPADGLEIRDLKFEGSGKPGNFDPTTSHDEQNCLIVAVTDAAGTGTVERFVAKNEGGFYDQHFGDSRVGVSVFGGGVGGHAGTLTFSRCRVEEFPNNGFYSSRHSGVVRIQNSIIRNNMVSQVRVGGDGSWVKQCYLGFNANEADVTNPHPPNHGTQCIAFDSAVRSPGGGGGYAEDCRIVLADAVNAVSAIQVWKGAGHHRVTGCDVTVGNIGDNVDGIRGSDPTANPNYPLRDDSAELIVEDTTVRGADPGGAEIRVINRAGSSITNACVDASNDRDGLAAESCTVALNNVGVHVETGQQTVGSFDPRNINTVSSCPTRPGSSVFPDA